MLALLLCNALLKTEKPMFTSNLQQYTTAVCLNFYCKKLSYYIISVL